jgi:hypothetical protein
MTREETNDNAQFKCPEEEERKPCTGVGTIMNAG